MAKKFNFQVGDIISYCGELFKILEVYSDTTGKVVEWIGGQEGVTINNNFKWSAYGSDCKLVTRN